MYRIILTDTKREFKNNEIYTMALVLDDIPRPNGMDDKTANLLGKNFSNRPEDQLNAEELAVSIYF